MLGVDGTDVSLGMSKSRVVDPNNCEEFQLCFIFIGHLVYLNKAYS